jgi:hypothetical protein
MEDLFAALADGDVGDAQLAELLGAPGASIDGVLPGWTWNGGLRYGQRMAGVDVEWAVTFRGATALHVAVYCRHPGSVAALLAAGGAGLLEAVALEVIFHERSWTPRLDGPPNRYNADGMYCTGYVAQNIKWRYEGVTPLHLAVSGEECTQHRGFRGAAGVQEHEAEEEEEAEEAEEAAAAAAGDEAYRQRALLVTRHLLLCLRATMRRSAGGAGGDGRDASWAVERRRALVEARCAAIEWWYRGGPFWRLDGATALHAALFFAFELSTGRGVEDARALVGLVHADRGTCRFRSICNDVSDLADGETKRFNMTAFDFAAWLWPVSEGRPSRAHDAGMAIDLELHEAYRAAVGDSDNDTVAEVEAAVAAASAEQRLTWHGDAAAATVAAIAVDEEREDDFSRALPPPPESSDCDY